MMASILAICGGIGLAICQWLIFCFAPVEGQMGLIQKIFYAHLPLAFWALISFFLVFIGSIGFLLRKSLQWDNFCAAAAEIGVLFCTLALLTGMVWAKKSWGVWWTWDPRLSTALVMWFIYAAYLIMGQLDLPRQKKGIIRAVIGIVAFLDVPLVFLSARIFRSIHPAVFASEGGGLEPEMRITAASCVLALGLFWLALITIRKRQLDDEDLLNQIFFSENDFTK